MFACTETVTDEVPSVTVNERLVLASRNGCDRERQRFGVDARRLAIPTATAVEDPHDHFNAHSRVDHLHRRRRGAARVPCTVTEVVLHRQNSGRSRRQWSE
jgi:hypothetical protein